MLFLNNLIKSKLTRKQRVGRGNGSGRGTYCGLGNKGQLARGSGKLRAGFDGGVHAGNAGVVSTIPKLRGFKSKRPKTMTLTLDTLDRFYKDGDLVSPETLVTHSIIPNKKVKYKIVASGSTKKNLQFADASKLTKTVKKLFNVE